MVLSRGDFQPRAQTASRIAIFLRKNRRFEDLSRTDLYWIRFAAGRAPWANLVFEPAAGEPFSRPQAGFQRRLRWFLQRVTKNKKNGPVSNASLEQNAIF